MPKTTKPKQELMKVFPVCINKQCKYAKDGYCKNTRDSKNTPCLGRHKEWKKYSQ